MRCSSWRLLTAALFAVSISAQITGTVNCSASSGSDITDAADGTALATACSNLSWDAIQISSSATGNISFNGLRNLTGDIDCASTYALGSVGSTTLSYMGTFDSYYQGLLQFRDDSDLYALDFPNLATGSGFILENLPSLKVLNLHNEFPSASMAPVLGKIILLNTALESFSGLSYVPYPNGPYKYGDADEQFAFGVNISQNTQLSQLELGLGNIGQYEPNSCAACGLWITDNAPGANISLPNLTYVGSDMIISNCATLSAPQLAFVGESGGGSLSITNAIMASLSLPVLSSVNGDLTLIGNFTSLSLPALKRVASDLYIEGNSGLDCGTFQTLSQDGTVGGSVFCAGRSSPSSTSSRGSSATSASQTSTATPTPTSTKGGSSSGLSGGDIGGIVVGVIAALLLAIGAWWFFAKRKGTDAASGGGDTKHSDPPKQPYYGNEPRELPAYPYHQQAAELPTHSTY